MSRRTLEPSIHTKLERDSDYTAYLQLDKLLDAQRPLSAPPHHDEMLFIIQHQVTELWIKLVIHELQAAMANLRGDRLSPAVKQLARVKHIQNQMYNQWMVLDTLTPSEYAEFRDVLSSASGFQSLQYRLVEFLMGNKNADMVRVFDYSPDARDRLQGVLEAPGLYDEFLRWLDRAGHELPGDSVERDWSEPYVRNPALIPVFKNIYDHPRRYWLEYDLCEKLVDVEESFQLWRFRHLKTVERIIGHKRGTGGSSGVKFLQQALELTFFPELLDVRTEIEV